MSEVSRVWSAGCLGKALLAGAGCVVIPIVLLVLSYVAFLSFFFLRGLLLGA